MEFKDERKIEMVEMDILMSEEEMNKLYEAGMILIKDDKPEVVNYMINRALREVVEGAGKYLLLFEKMKKYLDDENTLYNTYIDKGEIGQLPTTKVVGLPGPEGDL